MKTWDPDTAPDPEGWLALEESERHAMIAAWHRANPRSALHPPDYNLIMHAAMHGIVETQIASDDPPVTARTLARLQEAGIRRHAALHAIMGVLTGHIGRMLDNGDRFDDAAYAEALERLKPEDAIPREALGWMQDDEAGPPRNRAERRARKKRP